MAQPRYGLGFNHDTTDPTPAVATDMDTVFLIGSSEDATTLFPVNSPVVMNSSDTTMLAGLGTGALATAVQLINAQLSPMQLAARIVVNRIAKGASDDETIANILGSQSASTGIFGALRVGNLFGIVPRLFLVADGAITGKFTRSPNGTTVTEAAKFGGNTGNGLMTLANPAFGNTAMEGVYRVRCKTAAANGGVFSVVDPTGIVLADATVGTAYAGTAIKFTIADGTTDFIVGDGFDVTVTVTQGEANANAICAGLPQVLNALLAHAFVDGPGLTAQDAEDWRETIASDRIIPIDAMVAPTGALAGVFAGGAATAVGIQIAVDYKNSGIPSQVAGNQSVQGITALKRYDSFSLTDDANDGQQLLDSNVGIIERGETGVETAASSSGFTLIIFDNAGTDDLWRFYNQTRMRDYIDLQLMKLWRARLAVNNITRHAVTAVLNDAITFLGTLKTDEHIIDFRVGLNAAVNTPETIRAGKLRVYFKCEEASPLLFIESDVYRYRDALNTLVSDLATETNQLLVDTTVSTSS